MELAVAPETESSQPIAEGNSFKEIPSNIKDILAEERIGCGKGRWCCYFPATESYRCIECENTSFGYCTDSQQYTCNNAGGQSADDDFCG